MFAALVVGAPAGTAIAAGFKEVGRSRWRASSRPARAAKYARCESRKFAFTFVSVVDEYSIPNPIAETRSSANSAMRSADPRSSLLIVLLRFSFIVPPDLAKTFTCCCSESSPESSPRLSSWYLYLPAAPRSRVANQAGLRRWQQPESAEGDCPLPRPSHCRPRLRMPE